MYVSAISEFKQKTPYASLPALRPTSHGSHQTLAADSNLFFDGDEARYIYQICEGVLRTTKTLSNGEQQVIAFGYPGDFVGFPAAGCHHADCRSLTQVKVLRHKVAHLDNSTLDPVLHRRLIAAAMSEISQMQDHFLMLGRKSAQEKVASFLIAIADRDAVALGQYQQFQLPMCRADIADFLGLTVETISRSMTSLRSMGVIALENAKSIVVLDQPRLRALCESQ